MTIVAVCPICRADTRPNHNTGSTPAISLDHRRVSVAFPCPAPNTCPAIGSIETEAGLIREKNVCPFAYSPFVPGPCPVQTTTSQFICQHHAKVPSPCSQVGLVQAALDCLSTHTGIVRPRGVSGCVSSTELPVTEVDQADIAILIAGGDTWSPGSWPVASGPRVTVSCLQSTDCWPVDIQTSGHIPCRQTSVRHPNGEFSRQGFPSAEASWKVEEIGFLQFAFTAPSKEEDYHSRFVFTWHSPIMVNVLTMAFLWSRV